MKAVILCAKKKETLFPFSETKPTALTPIMGRPLVWHIIENLENNGINEIYLVTNYKEQMFKEEFEEYTNVNIVHQKDPEGTADAVKTCDFIEEDFVIVNGDIIVSSEDIKNLIDKHEAGNQQMTILATDENKPEKFGVLSIKDDKITSVKEKPEDPNNTLVNTGIYATSPEIFRKADENPTDSLADIVAQFADAESAKLELIKNHWIDIGSAEKLWKANQTKLKYLVEEKDISRQAKVSNNCFIEGNVVIRPGAEIKPGTTIEGTCYIGENAVIGPNTVLRDSIVNNNSEVRNTTLEKSVIFERCFIDPYVFIENSIIGEESSIKSGTVIKECFIGGRSYIEMNNSVRGTKFVPDARTDLGEITK